MLHLCTKHVHFSNDGEIYIHIDEATTVLPLGPVFMTELEITRIISLGNFLRLWRLIVDHTLAFVLPYKVEYIVNQFHTSDENIQFTYEIKEENKLVFLDVMVIRNTHDNINTKVY